MYCWQLLKYTIDDFLKSLEKLHTLGVLPDSPDIFNVSPFIF